MKYSIFLIKAPLLCVFLVCLNRSYSQKKDTIRIYNYEAGANKFKLIAKNNSEFTFTARYIGDTLSGALTKEGKTYNIAIDTNFADKWKKRASDEVEKSIRLTWNQFVNAPLLEITFDSTRLFHLDTVKLSKNLIGTYFTSTGFVGCTLKLMENGTIIFEPFNDVGGPESTDTAFWIKKDQTITLKGNSTLDSWFTDNKKFYLLKYFIIGKKVQKSKRAYIETYTYFIKASDDDY